MLLTGGVGSRLWPLSRKSTPKQYINLFGDKSLFEIAIDRNLSFTDTLCIVGNKANKHLSLEVLDRMVEKQKNIEIITEATPRNTASAIAFAAFSSKPEDILLVTPSDHIIKANENYDHAIQAALLLAEEGFITTFGITPEYPETGYGYIEYNGDEVVSFREKPNLETAEKEAREAASKYREILDQAKDDGQKVKQQIIDQANEEARAKIEQAQKEIETEKKQAQADMKQEIVDVAIEVATKVMNKEMNEEINKGLVEEFVDDVVN